MTNSLPKEKFSVIADELDNMLIAMCKDSWQWNYPLVKAYVNIVRLVCRELKDFELYHVVMKELVVKKFWQLSLEKKWQPLSLMTEYLSNGNVMNQMGKQIIKKIPKNQFLLILHKCPNQKAKKIFLDFRKYYVQ